MTAPRLCGVWLFAALVASGFPGAASAKPDLVLYITSFPGYMGGPADRPGILVELTERAAKLKGYNLEIRNVPWTRALKKVLVTPNSIIPGFSRIPSREKNYSWVVPQMAAQSAFLSQQTSIDSYAQGAALKVVGVHRSTSHHLDLKNHDFDNLSVIDNVEMSTKMLARGRIQAWYGDVNEYLRRWRDHYGDGKGKLVVGKILVHEEIWLAGNKDLPKSVISDLREAMETVIERGDRKELLKKYFGRD